MLDPRIERMMKETERESALPPWAAQNLREAVESSPYLVEVMTKAIDNGDLKHITVSKTPNEGALQPRHAIYQHQRRYLFKVEA
ncbi:hypothetical protein PUV44_17500 [Xanthomonas arboricola pv. corylina]|nr:hypothetical protein PUV44_17500 [Xanthomonas arboricola pv. corylina]